MTASAGRLAFISRTRTAVLGRVTQLSAITDAALSGPQSNTPAARIAAAPAVMSAVLRDQMITIAEGFTSIGKLWNVRPPNAMAQASASAMAKVEGDSD